MMNLRDEFVLYMSNTVIDTYHSLLEAEEAHRQLLCRFGIHTQIVCHWNSLLRGLI